MKSSKKSNSSQKLFLIALMFSAMLAIPFLTSLNIPKLLKNKKKSRNDFIGSLAWIGSPYSRYKKWIQAISDHETNGGTSNFARTLNNYFGMGLARIRPTTGKSSGIKIGNFEIARYKDINDSLKDFLLWLEYFNVPTFFTTPDDLVKFMKSKSYFEDTLENYLNGVKSWM